MKKILLSLLVISLCFGMTGCKEKKKEKIDYSKYSFTDVSWTRDAEQDIETIRFSSDGFFRYSCACGNPVNDADLCEKYTYDDEKKIIKLDCFETTEDTITTIKLVNYDENTLELDFDGEIRKFSKEK